MFLKKFKNLSLQGKYVKVDQNLNEKNECINICFQFEDREELLTLRFLS